MNSTVRSTRKCGVIGYCSEDSLLLSQYAILSLCPLIISITRIRIKKVRNSWDPFVAHYCYSGEQKL